MANKLNPLQKILLEACKGINIETRELLKSLSHDDLLSIKEGDLTADDLREIAFDIADSKDAFDKNTPLSTDSPPPISPD